MEARNRISDPTEQELEQQILFALKGIRYGSVEIIIHDSKVVQIERKEKFRFETTPRRHNFGT
jgi:hypothetical protein